MNSPKDEIARYLRTGQSDVLDASWPGQSLGERAQNGKRALQTALISEVMKRARHSDIENRMSDLDTATLAATKIGPMVRGLFPAAEQPVLMEMFTRSIVFLTSANIESMILKTPFASTAWDLANLYLLSCGAELLSSEALEMVGLSEETTCYVSPAYFHSENRLEDFVVHEAAHVFHNCKRTRIGLPEIRGREWLLEIDFHKRELFAYACEAYSCILACGDTTASRRKLLAEIASKRSLPDDRVDVDEYLAVLHEAVNARNGWKRILAKCAPPSRSYRRPIERVAA